MDIYGSLVIGSFVVAIICGIITLLSIGNGGDIAPISGCGTIIFLIFAIIILKLATQ